MSDFLIWRKQTGQERSGEGSSGDLAWQRTWGGTEYDWGPRSAVALDSPGNAYVLGTTPSFGASKGDVLLLKFDPSGNLLWQRTWGRNEPNFGWGLALDSSDDIYITGVTQSFGGTGHALFLVKFDSFGDLLWQRTRGGNDTAGCGYNVALDSLGDVYVVGITESAASSGSSDGDHRIGEDALLLKFGPSGNLLW